MSAEAIEHEPGELAHATKYLVQIFVGHVRKSRVEVGHVHENEAEADQVGMVNVKQAQGPEILDKKYQSKIENKDGQSKYPVRQIDVFEDASSKLGEDGRIVDGDVHSFFSNRNLDIRV